VVVNGCQGVSLLVVFSYSHEDPGYHIIAPSRSLTVVSGCRGAQVGQAACNSVIGPNERDPGYHIISHRPSLSHYGKLGKQHRRHHAQISHGWSERAEGLAVQLSGISG
jgi:hypothetical protein